MTKPELWIQNASADQLIDFLTTAAGADEEICAIAVRLRRILIDEEVIEA